MTVSARDGFVGVNAFYLAKITDEASLTYATPVEVPSIVGMTATRGDDSNPAYARDEVWIDAKPDTGGEGSFRIRDYLSDSTLRTLLAQLSGYLITYEGDLLDSGDPVPCAILVERSAYLGNGQRKCFYWCELGKPSFDVETKGETTEIGEVEFPFKFKRVTLGEGVRCATRDSFYGNSTYADFFNAVVKTYSTEAPVSNETQGSGTTG